MQQPNFEKLVEGKMDELKDACINCSEPHLVAPIQGFYKGLKLALELYRQAARIDADPDGDAA